MSKRAKSILWWIVYIAVLFLIGYLITHFIVQRAVVVGQSMEDTFDDGDNVITEKVSYQFSDPERYDIVIFPYKYSEDTYYIKRVIGLPGEMIQIKDGFVYIDGERLEDDVYCEDPTFDGGIASEPYELGKDEYFVLGDNRNNSHDSRYLDVGPIRKSEMIGKVVFRIWPLDKFGGVG